AGVRRHPGREAPPPRRSPRARGTRRPFAARFRSALPLARGRSARARAARGSSAGPDVEDPGPADAHRLGSRLPGDDRLPDQRRARRAEDDGTAERRGARAPRAAEGPADDARGAPRRRPDADRTGARRGPEAGSAAADRRDDRSDPRGEGDDDEEALE